jgi:hypothetical protein
VSIVLETVVHGDSHEKEKEILEKCRIAKSKIIW